MDHEYCKQHPRPMPAPAMAAIRVRREPKMGDLRESVRRRVRVARVEKMRVLTAGINYGARPERRGRSGQATKRG
jgi:hypothetical protein